MHWLTDEQIAQYNEKGYVFVPSLLSEVEIGVINAEVERIITEKEKYPGIILEKNGKTPRTIANPHLYSKVFERVIRHPKLVAAAQDLLEEEVYVFQMGINCKAAFRGDMWYWHQDFPGYYYDDRIPEPRMVNTIVFLNEVTEFNGPLMLLPGTHTETFEKTETTNKGTSYAYRYADEGIIWKLANKTGVIAPKGPAGCVNFQHPNILHGSTGNLSPWSRWIVTLTYNAFSNRPLAKVYLKMG